MRLNKRQKKFCELMAIGIPSATAYIEAGFSPNGAGQSANKLLKKSYIIKYLHDLEQKTTDLAQEQAVNTRLDNLKLLSEIANSIEHRGSDRIAAIREINQMQNFNTQVEKIETKISPSARTEDIIERIKKL